MSERCKDCGYWPNSNEHFYRCQYMPPVYVRCIVPGCMVRTLRPTAEGMCGPHLWDEKHSRYYAALARSA